MANLNTSIQSSVYKIPKSVKQPINISWILFLVMLLTSSIYFFLSQPVIPLNYTVARLEDQLVHKAFLFLFPGISILINVFHSIILKLLKKYSAVLLKLFAGTTLGLQILLTLALFRIIFITI